MFATVVTSAPVAASPDWVPDYPLWVWAACVLAVLLVFALEGVSRWFK